MDENFLPIEGKLIHPSSLSLHRAKALAELASSGSLPYLNLVECVSSGKPEHLSEVIVVEVGVERPQRPVYDIRYRERVAIVFDAMDQSIPEVLTLRPDFPWVPHVNLRLEEFPRSLCLYDRPWSELSSRWTPAVFVERIRFWLTATARGELHQDDQPLEPLLLHHGTTIVLPADIYRDLESDTPIRLDLMLAQDSKSCRMLLARRPPSDSEKVYAGLKCIATTFVAQPQVHGLVRRTPRNLGELHTFLEAGGIDLIGSLRQRMRDWSTRRLLQAKLTVIVALPLSRAVGGTVESWSFWVFATLKTIGEVGTDIGLWTIVDQEAGFLLVANESLRGQQVEVEVLSPYVEFSPASAASANAIQSAPVRAVAVGAGALGSQVIVTLARMGFGKWTVIDEDDLLPHNLARHILHSGYIGEAKATGVAHLLNEIYPDAATAIVADVLAPGDQDDTLQQAWSTAELILDISASATVARHLAAEVKSSARRMSVFLNPQGTDVVVLAEDMDREVPLDVLEMQYYRAVNCEPSLQDHLIANAGQVRYGRSCRDVSTTMSTAKVTMNAAIAAELVQAAVATKAASIKIVRAQPGSLAITPISIEPRTCFQQQIGEWTLILDGTLLDRLGTLRDGKLPNETGGVLVGHYDLNRKNIYVVDTIPSPPDSVEWPTLYIRGSDGLFAQVQSVSSRTGGQLEYVGEWHSHPDGCSTFPSNDDFLVFTWLTKHMSLAGLPALMAIAGQEGASNWFVGEMRKSGGWTVNV